MILVKFRITNLKSRLGFLPIPEMEFIEGCNHKKFFHGMKC